MILLIDEYCLLQVISKWDFNQTLILGSDAETLKR